MFVYVVVNLLLNAMEVLSVGGGALIVWSSKECVLYLCMSEVISSFRGLRAGSQVFALLMLFLCVISHTMWSDKKL